MEYTPQFLPARTSNDKVSLPKILARAKHFACFNKIFRVAIPSKEKMRFFKKSNAHIFGARARENFRKLKFVILCT